MKIRNGKVWGYIIKRVGVVGFFDQPERMFGGGSGEVEEEKGGEDMEEGLEVEAASVEVDST